MPAYPRSLLTLTALVLALRTTVVAGAQPAADRYGDPLPPGAVARMGTLRLRHAATTLAFAPDGKTFATGGADALIRLWDVADGREIRTFEGHAGQVGAVAFSTDGKRLFSCGFDGTVREWDPATGKEVRRAGTDPATPLGALVPHPTEPRLLTADHGGTVREWDLKEGKQTRSTDAGRTGALLALCPGGEHFIGYKDVLFTIRDADGKEVRRFPSAGGRIVNLTFSPDGKLLAAQGHTGQITVWDMKSQAQLATVDLKAPVPLFALSPDGRYRVSVFRVGSFLTRRGSRRRPTGPSRS